MRAINVNDLYKARCETTDNDPFAEIRVVGRVFMGEGEPDEFTVTSTHEFGEVVQTSARALRESYALVQSGDPDDLWETEL